MSTRYTSATRHGPPQGASNAAYPPDAPAGPDRRGPHVKDHPGLGDPNSLKLPTYDLPAYYLPTYLLPTYYLPTTYLLCT